MSQVIQTLNHPYFTIKLKIAVVEHITKCLMLNKSSGVTNDNFRTKKESLVPVTFEKMYRTSDDTKYYNSYRGSLMDDAPCSITFEMDENPLLGMRDSKDKEQSRYIVTCCIGWMGEEIKKYIPNSPVIRNLREGILMETAGNMSLTVWGNHIRTVIENRWYQI